MSVVWASQTDTGQPLGHSHGHGCRGWSPRRLLLVTLSIACALTFTTAGPLASRVWRQADPIAVISASIAGVSAAAPGHAQPAAVSKPNALPMRRHVDTVQPMVVSGMVNRWTTLQTPR
jgi:hypothetical protein